ncbi:hypothetical protein C8R44DRAFT_741420 [Mycena epipterygia]|nr:hypothetical protein C8R44DRAFT_741420 [Mycena epipterygia]
MRDGADLEIEKLQWIQEIQAHHSFFYRFESRNGPDNDDVFWTNGGFYLRDSCNRNLGVGFSYAKYGETVSTTEDAVKDVSAFVAILPSSRDVDSTWRANLARNKI